MPKTAEQRRAVALLASRLFDRVWGDSAVKLPRRLPAHLHQVIEAAHRARAELVPKPRHLPLFAATADLTSSRGFAEAILKAERATRTGQGTSPFLFDIEMPADETIAVSFGSGSDMMASTLFQVVGVGRNSQGQAARQRENRRLAPDRARAGEAQAELRQPSGSRPLVVGSSHTSSTSARTAQIRGPLADLLSAIRSCR